MKLELTTLLLITALFTVSVKAQESAHSIVEKALSQAKTENKNVFVKYSASWCGWCKKMSAQMKSEELKAFFEDNYVIVQLIAKESAKNKQLENPGSNELMASQGGDKAGLPFWVILDKDGKLIEDSFNSEGNNLGCPASGDEIPEFIAKLKKTSKLTDMQLGKIAEVFAAKWLI